MLYAEKSVDTYYYFVYEVYAGSSNFSSLIQIILIDPKTLKLFIRHLCHLLQTLKNSRLENY